MRGYPFWCARSRSSCIYAPRTSLAPYSQPSCCARCVSKHKLVPGDLRRQTGLGSNPRAIELPILSNTKGDFARHHVEPIVALEGVKPQRQNLRGIMWHMM